MTMTLEQKQEVITILVSDTDTCACAWRSEPDENERTTHAGSLKDRLSLIYKTARTLGISLDFVDKSIEQYYDLSRAIEEFGILVIILKAYSF